MAIITEMLGEKVISGFKGTLDFYYYKGIPCVRKWPTSPGHFRASLVQRGWTPFRNAVALWPQLSPAIKDLYQTMSSNSGLTNRDLFMRSYMAGSSTMYDLTNPGVPNPPEGYWALLDYWKEETASGWYIYTETDVPCHLWLCYTTVRPKKHLEPVLRRGLFMHSDPSFCFVSYTCIEQSDAGDTLLHEFHMPAWEECETRWFAFHGTIDNVPSPSVSPIFKLHWGTQLYSCEGGGQWAARCTGIHRNYAIFKPEFAGHLETIWLRLGRVGNPGSAYLALHTFEDGYPTRKALRFSDKRLITGMGEYPNLKWFTFQFPRIFITHSNWYALQLITHATLPDEVRWPGLPTNPCPDAYWMLFRYDRDEWFTYPNNDLFFSIRGERWPYF